MSNQKRSVITSNWLIVIASIMVIFGFIMPWETTYDWTGFALTSTGYAVASTGLSDQYGHLHWVYYLPIIMALVCGALSLIFVKRRSPRSISIIQLVLVLIGLLPFVLFFIEIKWMNQWGISYTEPRLGLWATIIGLLGILFGVWKNLAFKSKQG